MPWIVQLNEAGFDKQIQLVIAVNSAKTQEERWLAREKLDGFRLGCDTCGVSWRPCDVDIAIMHLDAIAGIKDRNLCCGVDLDWKPS